LPGLSDNHIASLFLVLKVKALHFFEPSINSYQITRYHISEDCTILTLTSLGTSNLVWLSFVYLLYCSQGLAVLISWMVPRFAT